eukprot:jgi/Psemu1/320473/estExt_fgenesh1_pm.C_5830001
MNTEYLEKLWAMEYLEISKDRRERLLNELHCISSRAVPESPEMIQSALALFQEVIDKVIPEDEKRAYIRACSMNSTYVHSMAFRLKFLRAELFHTRNAAIRYVRNLNYLLDKFGEIALMRQLYMSDLRSEELRFLKKGYMQVLPFRDRAGRRIVANLGSYGGFDFSMETKERVGAYINFSVLSEDVTSQRKGAVVLGLLSEEAIESTRMAQFSHVQKFMQAMPIRFSAHHSCLPDEFRFRVFKVMMLILHQGDARHLTRIHIGTQMECDYKLRTFGIPTEHIPRSYTGKIKDSYHKTFLKSRTAMDDHRKAEAKNDYHYYYATTSKTKPFPAIECPENNCFLVRKHGVAWNHPGNMELRNFLAEKEQEHGRKRLKGEFISSVVDELNARHIHILLFDEKNSWYTKVTEKEEIQKHVLQVVRDIRKRKSTKKCHGKFLIPTFKSRIPFSRIPVEATRLA